MPFDPTPGIGSATSFTPGAVFGDTPRIGETEPLSPETANPQEAGGPEDATGAMEADAQAPGTSRWWLLWFVFPAFLAGPGIIRAVRSRLRIRGGDPEKIWRELADAALTPTMSLCRPGMGS